jgi:hypothetical protein
MPGRQLCSEAQAFSRGYTSPACARRRAVLRETLEAFLAMPEHACLLQAVGNLQQWAQALERSRNGPCRCAWWPRIGAKWPG